VPYKINKVRSRHIYNSAEIAQCLGVTTKTIHSWIKNGLCVIDNESKPYLLEGSEVIRYLSKSKLKRKCKLREREFYCLACRKPRESLSEFFHIEQNDIIIGEDNKQVIIKGKCGFCRNKLMKFSTDKKAHNLINTHSQYRQGNTVLIENANHSLNKENPKTSDQLSLKL